ncbi:MAG TPA: exosortase/archaeosortase family protein [Chitinophagaceae bacterium]|nr:exosortase/archaeosortase family protein [Chitinophagaceae bacterium]
MYKNKNIWIYLIKFLGVFCVCYFGTLIVIGLAAPGNYYIPFVKKYLDYVSWIKISLLSGTEFLLSLFSIHSHSEPGFLQRINNGRGVIIAMDCVGYGVYSFWIAFVIANKGRFRKKIVWTLLGLLALWFINVIRITLFLLAINKGWPMPLGIDHHTWFNIAAYLLIFFLIWLYDRSFKENKINDSSFET